MIQITCPNCSLELEIDDGFRGGVCRCHSCGALLSVPDEPETPSPEPERPETPAYEPKVNTQSDEEIESEDPLAALQGSGSSPGVGPENAKTRPVQQKGKRPGSAATRSGKADTKSKTKASGGRGKQAKKASMGLTLVIMIVVLLGVIGILIKGIMDKNSKPKETVDIPVFTQIDKNPFLADVPNFFQMLVTTDTVVIIDASAGMREHLWQANAASMMLVKQNAGKHKLAFIYASENGVNANPAAISQTISSTALETFLEGQISSSGGGQNIKAAINQAIGMKPKQIILVLKSFQESSDPNSKEWDDTTSKLKAEGIKLSAVMITNISDGLKALCESSGGKLHEISAGQVGRWYEEHRNQSQKPEPAPEESKEKESGEE